MGKKYLRGTFRIFGYIFQWLQISVNFITMIYFIIGALSYALDWPFLNANAIAKFSLFMIIYWSMTVFQLGGIGKTDNLVKFCFIIGIIIPSIILLVSAILYVKGGNPVHFETNLTKNISNFSHQISLIALAPYILAFIGIEASASHINEMKNPNRDYPLTLFMLVIFAILLDSLGGLSVATVIPTDQLSLNQGVIQAVEKMVLTLVPTGKLWVRVIAVMMALGMLGEISSWIVGPVRGLFVTAELGILPRFFNKLNKKNVPTRLILFQGIVVSLFGAGLTILAGGNNGAFKMAMSLTVMIYLITYILIFLAYLKLSLKMKDTVRSFTVSPHLSVKLGVGGLGLVTSLIVLGTTFFPTTAIHGFSTISYIGLMASIFFVVILLSLAIYQRGKKTDNKPKVHHGHIRHVLSDEINPFVFPEARGEHRFERVEAKGSTSD